MKKTKFVVTGMTCSACSSHVERAVGKLDGVVRVSVNLLTGGMVAEYDEKALSPEDIVAAVEHAGYKAAPEGEEREKRGVSPEDERAKVRAKESKEMRTRLIVSLVFMVVLM